MVKVTVLSTAAFMLAATTAASAFELRIAGEADFNNLGPNGPAYLAANGINTTEQFILSLSFDKPDPSYTFQSPAYELATYSASKYELEIGGQTISTGRGGVGCSISLSTDPSANASSRFWLRCVTVPGSNNPFPNVSLVRFSLSYTPGTFNFDDITDSDIFSNDELYSYVSDGGMVLTQEFQISGGPPGSGNTAHSRNFASVEVDYME